MQIIYKAKIFSQKCYADGYFNKYKDKNGVMLRTCVRFECDNKFYVRLDSDPKKYCSSSCSAIVNNKKTPKRKLEGSCKICSISIQSSRVYCKEHAKRNIFSKELTSKECFNAVCKKVFYTKNKNKKFCSKPCNQSYNYIRRENDSKHSSTCEYCGGVKTLNSLSCKECYPTLMHQQKIQKWQNGEWNGGNGVRLSKTIRRFLLEEAGYKCKVCGFSELHPDDNSTILEINHIDGDGSNNSPENLEVLCPNHHALTSNYRKRNIGNGRKVYYIRINKQ